MFTETLRNNLCSPMVLAFGLGFGARAAGSKLELPSSLHASLSAYLLLAIGLRGGVELAHAPLRAVILPALATIALSVLTPLVAFAIARRRFTRADAAAIAAHYGSVSAVTFVAAQQFVQGIGRPAEGFLPALVALMESPGIHIALALGAARSLNEGALDDRSKSSPDRSSSHSIASAVREVLVSPTIVLLGGGVLIGAIAGEHGYTAVRPFFDAGFKGALTVFLLDMGLSAGSKIPSIKESGAFLTLFGIGMPLVFGSLGVLLGTLAGLSVGGAAVFGAMAGSASYIAAPAAVRMSLPEANPAPGLAAALLISFPFNLAIGIPLYAQLARLLARA
ncbi:MAG: sodium-dependent bicarbonate transport family permease [Polyangiales bacterium]